MIKVIGVSKSYNKGKVKAVDNLNLEVKPGEIFGFLGPNGAGKTTTIKMITGLLNPDKGNIIVNGYNIQKDPLKAKMELGFVPDHPDVYEKLTGIQYLNFMGDVYGVDPDTRKRRIEGFLAYFKLKDALPDLVQSYSHGMRQKLVIMGALLHNPSVWILDEPLVGLDPKSAYNLKKMMREHCNNGNTVFFSTHVMEIAEKICDKIGIIHQGRLIALGNVAELKSKFKKEKSLENIFLELTEDE